MIQLIKLIIFAYCRTVYHTVIKKIFTYRPYRSADTDFFAAFERYDKIIRTAAGIVVRALAASDKLYFFYDIKQLVCLIVCQFLGSPKVAVCTAAFNVIFAYILIRTEELAAVSIDQLEMKDRRCLLFFFAADAAYVQDISVFACLKMIRIIVSVKRKRVINVFVQALPVCLTAVIFVRDNIPLAVLFDLKRVCGAFLVINIS